MYRIEFKTSSRQINRISGTRLTVYAGLFVALGVILPFVTAHAYGLRGNVFLPMHIPVLLCGLICGAKRGFLCGILSVSCSCLLTGMPAPYPMLPIMLAELAMYGFLSGTLTSHKIRIVPAMLLAMIAGRICYGIMFYILLLCDPSITLGPAPLIAAAPVISALLMGVPGMIIQLTFIPFVLRSRVLR